MRETFDSSLYRRRKFISRFLEFFAIASSALGICWLTAILIALLSNGIAAFSTDLFTMMTPPPGMKGGLLNAIIGSLIITTVAAVISAPLGVMAGTYLSEYGKNFRFATMIRFINDILLGAPSIIIGVFVYTIAVKSVKHFSAWAGSIALAIIMLPIVVRTSEDMLRLVPNGLREAAAALGAPKWKITIKVTYRAAMQGILTGILLAMARISGETAPLLFTVLSWQFWSLNINREMANLPVVINNYANSAYEDSRQLAWGGALLITITILILNITARFFAARNSIQR